MSFSGVLRTEDNVTRYFWKISGMTNNMDDTLPSKDIRQENLNNSRKIAKIQNYITGLKVWLGIRD